jgi:hypothetical protein
LRHAKRLPSNKRGMFQEVKNQHKDYPIDGEVIYKFVQEIENLVNAIYTDPQN